MSHSYQEIREYLQTISVIDTHEHLPLNEHRRNTDTDFILEYFSQYILSDFVSCGLNKAELKKLRDRSVSLMDRWKIIEQYWTACKYTGYGRCIRETVKLLYGADDITANNVEALNAKFLAGLKPGRFREILKDRCNIKTALLNNSESYDYFELLDREFFSPVYSLDCMITPNGIKMFEILYEKTGIKVLSFRSWLDACKCELENICTKNTKIFKTAISYIRSLYFGEQDYTSAESEFNSAFRQVSNRPTFFADLDNAFACTEKFQNYMVHFVLEILSRFEAVLQVHTGMHEGNWNIVGNSDPTLLTNLINRYADIKFDLFHIGYPYQNKLIVLAKNYPNVFVNMCWAHIISPNASIDTLSELIDAVPANKVCAFGGDFSTVEQIAGHLNMAKDNVAKALSLKTDDKVFDTETAKEIANRLFFFNPCQLYQLKQL